MAEADDNADFDDSDAEWESFNEPEVAPTLDLFDATCMHDSAAACLAQAKAKHGLDLAAIAANLRLDIYGRVQLVNYVRSLAREAGSDPKSIVSAVQAAAGNTNPSHWPWGEERFLRPVLPEDPLLYSLGAPTDTADDEEEGHEEVISVAAAPGASKTSADDPAALLETIQLMRSEMASMLGLDAPDADAEAKAEADAAAAEAAAAAAAAAATTGPSSSDRFGLRNSRGVPAEAGQASSRSMDTGASSGRNAEDRLPSGRGAEATKATTASRDGAPRGAGIITERPGGNDALLELAGRLADSKRPRELDATGPSPGQYGSADDAATAYFESYSKHAIHEEMLADGVRTMGYRDAIMKNAHLIQGKVVLDVGCGTGILSMFCAKAGAKHVVAIDASDIVDQAKRIVSANHLSDRITVLRGTMETISLPEGITSVDIIVSEWMGYALLYESMLPSVLFARDKYLAKGGVMLPSAVDLHITASCHHKLGFWDDVYGFDMTSMKESALKEAQVEVVPRESLLSAPARFHLLDLLACNDGDLDFKAVPFRFTIGPPRDEPSKFHCGPALGVGETRLLRCLVLHFDTIFDCTAQPGGVRTSFTTSPESTATHWKQTALYLNEPIAVALGETITGTVSFSRGLEYKRAYDIAVTVQAGGRPSVTQLWRL